jgi:Ca2+-binding EF-hand superfamily protein
MMTLRAFGLSALAMGLMVLPARADEPKVVVDLPGPIDSLQDLEDTGKILFIMADENKDGQISQQEANDAVNQMVGGVFFRADKDGNGSVSKEEAQQVRETLLQQRPVLRVLVQRARARDPQATATARNAEQTFMNMVDTNGDGQIQAPEVKQSVQSTVQGVYSMADTNRDGQLSPSEVNAALAGAGRTAIQAAYKRADADGNGQLSQDEFDKAIVAPAHVVFILLDSNNDGQLSPQEFRAAERALATQLHKYDVPERDKPMRMIGSGRPLPEGGERP